MCQEEGTRRDDPQRFGMEVLVLVVVGAFSSQFCHSKSSVSVKQRRIQVSYRSVKSLVTSLTFEHVRR